MMDAILFTIIWNILIALPVVGVLRAARFHLRRHSAIGRLFCAFGFTVLFTLVLEDIVFCIDGNAEMQPLLFIAAALACLFVLSYIDLQEHLLRNDGLTGAGSRTFFECRLSEILRQNNTEPFGMIYLDVDNFKDINDRHGHLAGDEALKALVSVVKSVLRRTDTISRLGGDEFGILVHVESQEDLIIVARKIEQALEAYNRASGKPYRISCSMGVKLFHKSSSLSVKAVLQQVDDLMYHCKKDKKTVDQES